MTIVEEIDKAKENLWKTYDTVKEEQDAGRVSACVKKHALDKL